MRNFILVFQNYSFSFMLLFLFCVIFLYWFHQFIIIVIHLQIILVFTIFFLIFTSSPFPPNFQIEPNMEV